MLQGERPMARDNKLIGNFRLDGIAPAPRGLPQIEVTFDIDANGILNVSAKDKSTGKEQKITITNSSGLSKEEVENLRKEAELHAAEDALIKETAEARNELDNIIYSTEKQLKEFGDKLPADSKSDLESEIAAAKEVLAKQDAAKDALKGASEKLMGVLQKHAQHLQAAASAGNGGAASGASGAAQQASGSSAGSTASASGPGDSVDADFEVVDDDDSNKKS